MPKEIAAGVIAYYYDDSTSEYKFLMAHPGGPYFKNVNKYGFPKGHVENDESYEHAAIREFQEETGLVIDQTRLWGHIECKGKKKNVHYYLYPMTEIWALDSLYSNQFYSDVFKCMIDEIDDYRYVSLIEMTELLLKRDEKVVVELQKLLETEKP